MSMDRRVWLLAALALAGCASAPPPAPSRLPLLRLQPQALGDVRFALSQRLSVTRLDAPDAPPQRVDVQLQADASGLLLAAFAFGQRVLLMRWDGAELGVQRHPQLPAEVDTDRMLRDLCLVLWPLAAVQAALPAPWRMQGDTSRRELLEEGRVVLALRITGTLGGRADVDLVNHAEGYRLVIESKPQE